jgi:hypothetical protein
MNDSEQVTGPGGPTLGGTTLEGTTPAASLLEDTLLEDAPVEDAPVEDAPVEEAPVEEATLDESGLEEALWELLASLPGHPEGYEVWSPPVPAAGVGGEGVLPGDLGEDQLLDSIRECALRVSAVQARQVGLIGELAHRRAGTAVSDLTGRRVGGRAAVSIGARAVADELGVELLLDRGPAERLTDTAVGLCLEAPETLDALARG